MGDDSFAAMLLYGFRIPCKKGDSIVEWDTMAEKDGIEFMKLEYRAMYVYSKESEFISDWYSGFTRIERLGNGNVDEWKRSLVKEWEEFRKWYEDLDTDDETNAECLAAIGEMPEPSWYLIRISEYEKND